MKLEWSREELTLMVSADEAICGICGNKGKLGDITHFEECPFFDETVEVLFFVAGPQYNDNICDKCTANWDECPAKGDWDKLTHERLLLLCDRYAGG